MIALLLALLSYGRIDDRLITFYLDDRDGPAYARAALSAAISEWTPYLPRRRWVEVGEVARVRVRFVETQHAGCYTLENTAAHAFVPISPRAGDIHLRRDFDWTEERLRFVLMHELGHVLGLPDVYSGGQLMSMVWSGVDGLQAGDRAMVQAIYGRRETR